jgi:predicted RNase H-like nuclease (RuvC/YqgF family)
MKSDPIKGWSDVLGKLVVEHGSSVIQEKHISLLKEQFAILERENEALKKEIMQLKKRIKSDEQPVDNNLLHEIEIKVLLYLSSNSGRNTKQISKALNIAEEIIKLHTEILKTKSMIASGDDPANDDIWSLDLAGRRYLIENDLIEHESIS